MAGDVMDCCRSDSTIGRGRQRSAKPSARFGWRRCGFLATGLLSCLVAGAASAPPEREQQPTPPQPTFRTEANYVRVDVYPTRDNAPVMDLRQDEFDVLENGVPQRIEQFEHVVICAAGPQETRVEPNT